MATVWRENKKRTARANYVLGGLEGALPLLSDANEHDSLCGSKPWAIACSDIVFALAALELKDRHQWAVGKCGDVLNEAIVNGANGGRRGDGLPR